jgi:hypothetical protein
MNLLKLSKNHFDKLYNEDIAEYKYDFGYIIDYICLPIVDSIIMSCSIDENNTITPIATNVIATYSCPLSLS